MMCKRNTKIYGLRLILTMIWVENENLVLNWCLGWFVVSNKKWNGEFRDATLSNPRKWQVYGNEDHHKKGFLIWSIQSPIQNLKSNCSLFFNKIQLKFLFNFCVLYIGRRDTCWITKENANNSLDSFSQINLSLFPLAEVN